MPTRLMAILLLLISLSMTLPLGQAAIHMANGATVSAATWIWPMLILATGTALIWILSRKQVPMQLYVAAFALWVLTAIYFWWVQLSSRA